MGTEKFDIEAFRLAHKNWLKAMEKAGVSISSPVVPGMYIGGVRVADVTKVEMERKMPKTQFASDFRMPISSKNMTLESAIALAANAHRGQKDLAGEPYILHPLRVMSKFKTYEARMTAVLHDVVEDTEWTIESLMRANVPSSVIHAVGSLTRNKAIGELYMDYIRRVCTNYYAVHIKIEDLRDNLDMNRLSPEGVMKYKGLFKREQKALDYCLTNSHYNGVL